MNQQDQDYDTNSIDEQNLPDGMHVIDETESSSDEEFESVIKKIQSSVKEFSKRAGDTTTVKEAIKQALLASKPGSKKTESTYGNTAEGDTMNAKQLKATFSTESIVPEVVITPATPLPNISRDLRQETLTSLDLIKSSAKHLHDLMKSVVQSPESSGEPNPFKLTDIERAQTSAVVAKQFYSVMRLQFEAIKLVKEIGGE